MKITIKNCFKKICKIEDVEEVVRRLNAEQDIKRNEQLEEKLDYLYLKISNEFDAIAKKRVKNVVCHTTAPETQRQIDDLKKLQKEILSKLDSVMPTIKEINELRTAWKWTGITGSVIGKIVIWLTVIIGALVALKNWIKS